MTKYFLQVKIASTPTGIELFAPVTILRMTDELELKFHLKLLRTKIRADDSPFVKFAMLWIIFDAYLVELSGLDNDRASKESIGKLDWFLSQDETGDKSTNPLFTHFVSAISVSRTGALKELSKYNVVDLRPRKGGKVYALDKINNETVLNYFYQIRCNLFHGAMDVSTDENHKIVYFGNQFMEQFLAPYLDEETDWDDTRIPRIHKKKQ